MTETKAAHTRMGHNFIPQELSRENKDGILALGKACDLYEGIGMKLHRSMIELRKPGERRDLLWLDPQGSLVGYLGLNSFEPGSAEVVAMVHPDHRRRGIFTELFRTAGREAKAQGISKLILICPQDSASGQACVKSLGLTRSFSEYVMKWSEEDFFEKTEERRIALRLCGPSERELILTLDMRGFGMSREDAEPFLEKVLENYPEDRIFAAFREDGQPVGKICIQLKEGAAHLFGFSVLPEWRGQGLGRSILRESISLARGEGCQKIGLEVECENRNALGLYHSCGFRETAVQDYYEIQKV